MYQFGKASKAKLATIHPDLQKILSAAIKHIDFTIVEGMRTLETQKEYVRIGRSKTLNSKHLEQDDGYSHAVDVAPWPIDWDNRERFIYLQGIIKGIACEMGIDIRSGIDWDGDGDITDTSFFDGPHIELKR